MNKILERPTLKNEYIVPCSKSVLHRLLILQAFAKKEVEVTYDEPVGDDIKATIECLKTLKAYRDEMDSHNFENIDAPTLDCRDSGSTYRFLLGVTNKLGIKCKLTGTNKLIERVNSGAPTSQFLTGEILGTYLAGKDINSVTIPDNQVSKSYIDLTKDIIKKFDSNSSIHAEGDWSLGALWLVAGAISGRKVAVKNLDDSSMQGDKRIVDLIKLFAETDERVIDGSLNPDLVPILSVLASFSKGTTRIENIEHLRHKESDRVESPARLINNLGGNAITGRDYIEIEGKRLTGGTVDAENDHRIAMAAGIAAFGIDGKVEIIGAEAVGKSYPKFWEEF